MLDQQVYKTDYIPCIVSWLYVIAAYFWYRETLDISSDVESPESINWVIGICLVSSWLLVYLAMVKGITESPKVVYVRLNFTLFIPNKFLLQITAIFPYVVLVIFFFRAVTLKGMGDGVIHLFTPKVKIPKILNPTKFRSSFLCCLTR